MSRKKKNTNIDIKKVLGLVAALVLCFVVLTAVRTKKESFSSRLKINIEDYQEGKSMLLKEDVKTIIERTFGYDLVGVAIDDIQILEVENVLSNVPMIKKANVYIDALNKVHVDIVPRHPVLRMIDNNGNSYYLDDDAVRIPISQNFTPRVLIANGNISEFNSELFEEREGVHYDLYHLAMLIKSDEFLDAQIEQIYVTKNGEFEFAPKVGKQKILFGEMDLVEDKLENLKIFYRDGMPYKGWNTYKTIDLRFNGQVIGKKHSNHNT